MSEHPGGQALASANILIVDDSPMNVALLTHILTREGHTVQSAPDGLKALEAARNAPPDLILLDIMMPEMDGFEVCRRLKADEQTCHIPVIFISALDATDHKIKALGIGGVDYVTKPFNNAEVTARVHAHLSIQALQKQLRAANLQMSKQLEEVQARNEELDAFAHAIAHDLKSPLTKIIGYAEMLENLQATLPPEQLKESLRAIAANGRKMDKIIEDLLLLSKVRQAQQMETTPLDMASIVAAALKRLDSTIKESQAEVVLPAGWPTALGHAAWVEEVWINSISTAIAQGGQPPRVELGATPQPDGSICFWVRDNGTAATAEAARKGAGLGGFIVRRIMKQLGLQAAPDKSAADQGNTFAFNLPAASAAQSRPASG